MIIGAILTQNTNWKNVEKALANLRRDNLLSFIDILNTPILQLENRIKPSGYFRQKSKRLKDLATAIVGAGGLHSLQTETTSALRNWLLDRNGIGPETADSILLYAFNRPVFVIDSYTLRICKRHQWLPEAAKYSAAQNLFCQQLPLRVDIFNEFHALIVQVGKNFCHIREPLCQGCPLEQFLNH
jgi:endonuclease-3 related protein